MLLLTSWPTASLADGAVNTHTVQPGESVRSIAQANGISSETVLAANTMTEPDLLQVGQQLLIPAVDGVLHTVAADETLSEIADAYGVSTDSLASANGLQGSADQISVGMVLVVPGASLASSAVAAAAPSATPTPATRDQASATPTSAPDQASRSGSSSSSPVMYTVQDGDTLRSIADAFNLDILSLVAMNGLDNPDVIRPGSTLRVSAPPKEYVVQAGDTLGDIADRYSLSSAALLRANGLADADLIVTGMTLVLPASAAAPQASTSASAASASVAAASAPAPASAAQPAAAPQRASAPASSRSTASAPAAPAAQSKPAAPAPAAAAPAPASQSGTRVISALITGYAPGAGASSSHTASGTATHWGTVAADTRLYPFGTRLRIQGMGDTVFTVEDTGSAVRGNVFDVWFPDAASARGIGPGTRQVTILGPGDS
jgi:LysM repeat protein